MIVAPSVPESGTDAAAPDQELRALFHRLNNQLGIILAHAELLELKTPETGNRARASQIVASALDAMGTSREIIQRIESPEALIGHRPATPRCTCQPSSPSQYRQMPSFSWRSDRLIAKF